MANRRSTIQTRLIAVCPRIKTANERGSTHKRAKGHAPVWGSEFTTKAAIPQKWSEELVLNPFVVFFCQVFTTRMIHEVSRAEEFAEGQLRVTAPIQPGSSLKSTPQGTYLPTEASW
jgi:hypothetical protein